MKISQRSSLLLTLAGIAGCGAISIEANALVQSGPQSEAIGRMLVEDLRLDMDFDFTLSRLTNESGEFLGYELSGNGSSITIPATVCSAEVTFSFTSRNEDLTVDGKGGGIHSMTSASGKKWFLRKNACEDPNNECYAVIDPDLTDVLLNVVAVGGWHLSGEETPALSEMIYLLVMDSDPNLVAHGCDVTLLDCLETAQTACAPRCVHSLSYTCNTQTGTYSCGWTCCPEDTACPGPE